MVSTAGALVTVPQALVAMQSYGPLSASETLVMVSVTVVAPEMVEPVPVGPSARFAAARRHWYVKGPAPAGAKGKTAAASGQVLTGCGCVGEPGARAAVPWGVPAASRPSIW